MKNIHQTLVFMFLVCVLFVSSNEANAYICGTTSGDFPDKVISLHSFGIPAWCDDHVWREQSWREHGFVKNTWDDGFGYHYMCNPNRFLTRFYNYLRIIDRPFGDNPHQFQSEIFTWVGLVIDNVWRTKAVCYTDSNNPCQGTERGCARDLGNRVWYTSRLFTSDTNIGVPTGLIGHEARHTQGYPHTADPDGNGRYSIDRSFEEYGAMFVEFIWAAEMGQVGNPDLVFPLRCDALFFQKMINKANGVATTGFETPTDMARSRACVTARVGNW